jgi:hypothetical protein
VKEAGTTAAALLLDNPTCTPPDGAADASVTVPVALWPLVTEEGETERLSMAPLLLPLDAGLTESVAEAVLAEDAVMVAVVGNEIAAVETGKVAVVCPDGTVTDAGTVTFALLLDSPTCTPSPDGAAEARLTVPVAV